MHFPFDDIRCSLHDSSNINHFFVAGVSGVKCGLYKINKNNRANATRRPSPVHKMFQDRIKAMLDWRDLY